MVTKKREKRNQKNKEEAEINLNRTLQDEFLEFIFNLNTFDNILITSQEKESEKEKSSLSGTKFFTVLSDFEKSISQRIEENKNIGVLSSNKNSLAQEVTEFGENLLELEVYSKIYWADLGTYFLNLLYSQPGVKPPKLKETPRNNRSITNLEGKNKIFDWKNNSDKLENNYFLMRKNFDINYDTINLITGIEANRLTSYYNADALTIGNNIFFSQNKLDLNSPQGIGLLAHELVHVKQMKENPTVARYSTTHGLNMSVPSSVKSSDFENEAVEEEERIISYMNSQQKNLFEDTNDVNTTTTSLGATNNNEIPFFSNSFGLYDNTFSYSYLDIFNNISRNINVTDTITHNVDDNDKNRRVPNQGLINRNFINSSVYPLLSNPHIFRDLDYVNSEYLSFQGQNTSHDNSNSPSYPPTPILFASRDRTVNPTSSAANSIPTNSNTMANNSTVIQPDISSAANNTNNFPSVDIEYLADRVYNIFQNKIQIQKMRRGLS